MSDIDVRFLFFEGCPLAATARRNLEHALNACGIASYAAFDIFDHATPDDLRGWGSPTILVNGVDVGGHGKGDSPGCRIYVGVDKVPGPEAIAMAIRDALGAK